MKRFVYGVYHFLWAWLGARLHGGSRKRIFVIGITGTKGKTTTVELVNAILEAAGKRTAILSSLRIKIAESSQKNPTSNSMPGRAYLQKFLKRARRARCQYAIIEVTSQGVVQHRHRFIDWDMGVITNLTPEHIESHGSFEKYRAAKLSFLKYVVDHGGKVFLNRDDEHFDFFMEALGAKQPSGEKAISAPREQAISFSRTDERLADVFTRAERTRERRGESRSRNFVLSEFNEENVAAAAAIAKELGISDRVIEDVVTNFEGVPGRMQFVSAGPYTAIVDYAHTPDSLEAAYRAAREELHVERRREPRLICVLGAAGGGRDAWKRPEFGKIAAHYCDEIILTDEDPYNEDSKKIIDEIAAGVAEMPYPRPEPVQILDRREALAAAITMMDEGDIVIATGKGSEDWIHVARRKKIPWNEKAIVEELLAQKETGET